MSQTYAQFKTYLATFLWRDGDTEFEANLDNLIKMADAELSRRLNIQRRNGSITIAPESETHSLPTDVQQLISVSNLQLTRQSSRINEMSLTSYSTILELRASTNSTHIAPYYYFERRDGVAPKLELVGPFSASNPGSMGVLYRTAIPDYSSEDASWVEDSYLDLYTYAVMKHAAVFSREEERIQFYVGLMEEALNTALQEDKHEVQFGGSPLYMKPHRPVPRRR